MLSLQSSTPPEWVDRIRPQISEVLVDHAHCEKKAAGVAMNLIFSYVEHTEFAVALSEIVEEELQHFREVLAILHRREIPLRGQTPSSYGKRLAELVRKDEIGKAVDRCCIAALIEARSCERFMVLRDHLGDSELCSFYGRLLESEARHHGTYVRLARHFAPEATVMDRLAELSAREAQIIARGDDLARLHS